MALWTYADWVTQTDKSTRLTRLRLHIEEVSQRIMSLRSRSGRGVDAPDQSYLDSLRDEERRLAVEVEEKSGFARNLARFQR